MTPLTSGDIDALRRIGGDGSIFRYIPDIAQPFDPVRLFKLATYNRANSVAHLVRLRGSKVAIGFMQVGLRRNAELQIGYFMDRDYWGRHLATEAIGATMAFLLSIGVPPLFHAAVHPENAASLRVLQRLGFRRLEVDGAVAGARQGMVEHVWSPDAR
jgi:RimJ/RimL family protein N-acetyltransferase